MVKGFKLSKGQYLERIYLKNGPERWKFLCTTEKLVDFRTFWVHRRHRKNALKLAKKLAFRWFFVDKMYCTFKLLTFVMKKLRGIVNAAPSTQHEVKICWCKLGGATAKNFSRWTRFSVPLPLRCMKTRFQETGFSDTLLRNLTYGNQFCAYW